MDFRKLVVKFRNIEVTVTPQVWILSTNVDFDKDLHFNLFCFSS